MSPSGKASAGKDIMAFVAQCNYCSSRFKLDNRELGASCKCPKCGNQFTAFPLEEGAATSTPLKVEGADGANGRVDADTRPRRAVGAGSADAFAAHHSQPSATRTSKDADDGATIRQPLPMPHVKGTHPAVAFGTAGFILGGFAWLFASIAVLSFLPLPMSILGLLLVGLGALSDDKSAAGKTWLALGGGANASILLMLLLWPTFFSAVRGQAKLPDYSKPLIVSAAKDQPTLRPLREEFLDADKGALRLENFQARVVAAEPVKDAAAKANPKKQTLRVVVQASCVVASGADQPLNFESWTRHGARLTSATGEVAPLVSGPPPKDGKLLPSKGALPLLPGATLEDVLHFDTSAAPPPWILELPNAAWGKPGSLKFRIAPEFMQRPAFPGKGGP